MVNSLEMSSSLYFVDLVCFFIFNSVVLERKEEREEKGKGRRKEGRKEERGKKETFIKTRHSL